MVIHAVTIPNVKAKSTYGQVGTNLTTLFFMYTFEVQCLKNHENYKYLVVKNG